MTDLLEQIDAVQINLDRRTDRWENCLENRRELDFPNTWVQRFSGIPQANFGHIGCVKAHMLAVARHVALSDKPFGLILEDDFRFRCSRAEFELRLAPMMTDSAQWDVIVLNGTLVAFRGEKMHSFQRILECHSGAGYLFHRAYATRLLKVFADSVRLLEPFRSVKDPKLRSWLFARYANDILWKPLQWEDRWYIGTPSLGETVVSYSDNEEPIMDQTKITHR